jgi:hypothetical protein
MRRFFNGAEGDRAPTCPISKGSYKRPSPCSGLFKWTGSHVLHHVRPRSRS